jgi:hypothetical protein
MDLAAGRAHRQGSPGLLLPSARVITAARQQPLPFGLWLGQSTGLLTALGHGAGLTGGYPVVLGLQDAASNIAICMSEVRSTAGAPVRTAGDACHGRAPEPLSALWLKGRRV